MTEREAMRQELVDALARLDAQDLDAQRMMARYYGVHPKHLFHPRGEFLAGHVGKRDTILDLGSAGGVVTHPLAAQVRRIISVDRCPADSRFGADNMEHVEADVVDYVHSGQGKYTVAFLSHILEHLDDPVRLLSRLRCRKVVVIVPHMENWSVLTRKDLGADWMLDAEHRMVYTRETLRQHLTQGGFSRIRVLEFDGDNGIRAVAQRPRSGG